MYLFMLDVLIIARYTCLPLFSYQTLPLSMKYLRNNMSTTFLQQILSGRLLLVVIVGLKK